MTECPETEPVPDRAAFSFDQMGDATGVLWLINRVVFHPRGFALALEYGGGDTQPSGWSIQGDGSEPWRFSDEIAEDERFAAVEALFAAARAHGGAP